MEVLRLKLFKKEKPQLLSFVLIYPSFRFYKTLHLSPQTPKLL